MDSDYYCCHGEDVSRYLVTLGKDRKQTHASNSVYEWKDNARM